MLHQLWMGFAVLVICMALPVGDLMAKEAGNWDKLLLVPGYFGKGISSYPLLTLEEEEMIQAISELPYLNKSIMVVKERGNYFAFIRCFLGVYRWDGQKWVLFSGGKVTGYNCSSYEFFQNGEIHQFSGRGYWQSNSDLFLFDENSAVKFVRTFNQPDDYYGWLKFKTELGIYSIFGIIDYDKIQTLHLDPEGYFLDFKDWTWKKTSFKFKDAMKELVGNRIFDQEFKLGGTVETQDFALQELYFLEAPTVVWLIFEKQTAQIYLTKSSKFLFEKVRWLQTDGNLIRFLTEESSESRTIDVAKQVESATLVGEIELSEDAPLSDFLHREWVLFLGGGLLVLSLLWLIWRLTEVNFDEQKISLPEPEIDFPVQFSYWLKKLTPHSGKLISQAQLEVILGVDSVINQDIRKVRRSRGIQHINAQAEQILGSTIITRVRDASDKRVILYQISNLSSPLIKTTEPKELKI